MRLRAFVAPGQPPTSCASFLAAHPEQATRDGIYRIEPSKPLDAYCDMTTDAGGWTLVARVLSTSSDHVTANEAPDLTAGRSPPRPSFVPDSVL